jgi:membrane-associated phospholipid phosphatase
MLGEFAATGTTTNPTWDQIPLPGYPAFGTAAFDDEINELVQLIDYRPGVMTEAMMQRNDLLKYWCGVLLFGASSHPYTYDLMEIAFRVAQFQVMHYKRMANGGKGRPRPSQICPALMPPIEVPGHASFPSGHATESLLISLCLAEVMPNAVKTPYIGDTTDPDYANSTALLRLAQRIARNREVLGLHYPSDSNAGRELARGTFKILMQCPTVANHIIPEAKKEFDHHNY